MPNVVQLDRPAPSAELLVATPDSNSTIPPPTVKKPILSTQILPFDLPVQVSPKPNSTLLSSDSGGLVYVSRSDRKIMRQHSEPIDPPATTEKESVTFIVEFDGEKITTTSTSVSPRSRRPRPTTRRANYSSHKPAFSRPRATSAAGNSFSLSSMLCIIFTFSVLMSQLGRIL